MVSRQSPVITAMNLEGISTFSVVLRVTLKTYETKRKDYYHRFSHYFSNSVVCAIKTTYSTMAESNASGNNAPTVTFDVGGTIYEVSRSLIERYPDTMLARMVSDTWLEGEQKEPLFIDRNGDRFQYCLDYMRDGPAVALPFTVSKESVLKELEYFGFDNADPTDLTVGPSTAAFSMSLDYLNNLETTKKLDVDCAMLAHYCFLRFKCSGALEISFNARMPAYRDFHDRASNKQVYYDHKINELAKTAESSALRTEGGKACFNKHLAEYGLKAKPGHHGSTVQLDLVRGS
jgi:hypothetical protein